jgi:Zn-dependent peptidase ImmA (M78 family)
MSTPTKQQISASRALYQCPYAHLDGDGNFDAAPRVVEANAEQVSADRLRLKNQYAHLDGAGNLRAQPAPPPTAKERQDGPAQNTPSPRKGVGIAWIEQAARKLQRDIWQRRHELWPNSVPSDPAKLLDPEVAFRLIGFQYELAETLGQYSNESGTFEVAGIIDRPSRRVRNSRQLPFETRAFTAAHELGHALLHEGMRMHRDRPLDGSQQDRGRRDRAEYEADKFASFFLMPENLLRNRFRQLFLCDRFGIDEATAFALDPADKHRLLAEKKTPRDLSRILVSAASYNGRQFPPLAKQFNVSVEAMAIRLEELDSLDV